MPASTTSEAQVCNLALTAVGQRQYIDSLNEPSAESKVCKAVWELTRDTLLSSYWWRFNKKRASLALSVETRDGWGFCYSAPADMLVARYIWSGDRNPDEDTLIPFDKELAGDDGSQLIVCDVESASLVYTKQLTQPALWPPYFVNAMAAVLAPKLAQGLAVRPELVQSLNTDARVALTMAVQLDFREGQKDKAPDSEFIRVR
jgi:hypothetical protein